MKKPLIRMINGIFSETLSAWTKGDRKCYDPHSSSHTRARQCAGIVNEKCVQTIFS
jgi:hypothetical protein